MNDDQALKISRRHLLQWSAPVITAVTLPAHAQMSLGPSFAVTKEQTGGPNPVTAAGDVIEYTITVTNDGDVDLTDVSVIDSMPDGSSGTLSSVVESITADNILEVGESWTFTTEYTVTLDDLRSDSGLVNTVTVEANETTRTLMDTAETEVSELCACEGPPVLTVTSVPKCSGNPPVGTAVIEITLPGDCDMEIKSFEFTTTDDKSSLESLPTFPLTLTSGSAETFTWIGPASDAVSCLPLAQIDATIEYCCEDEIVLTQVYDITQLLIDSVP